MVFDSVVYKKSSCMTTLENCVGLHSSLPRISSSKEIATAPRTPAQTLCRAIAVLPFHLVGGFFCDNVCLIIVHIIKCQFRPRCNRLGRKKGEIIDIDIGVVVRDCVDGAVGFTGVVNEPGRPP